MLKRCPPDWEKLQHIQYLINALLPVIKQIRQDQDSEITLESVSKGININFGIAFESICTVTIKFFLLIFFVFVQEF